MDKIDFSGWATKNNLKCSDGRTIMRDAFKHNDGQIVPLVWNHQHNDSMNILGHALLENRDEGVYAYCTFNETESGQNAKELVMHGDVSALSIYANKLKQTGGNVSHGEIREVSLVLAGANPGAFIDSIVRHGETADDEAIIYNGEGLTLSHAADSDDETVEDVFNTLSEKQKTVVYAMLGAALEEDKEENQNDTNKGGNTDMMKHNAFDQNQEDSYTTLSHADGEAIIEMAKTKSVGSLQEAITLYAAENGDMKHSFDSDDIELLFPEFKDVHSGAPELITRDQTWVDAVIKKTHKSPNSRIRTRQTDARELTVRAKGYTKGAKKTDIGNIKLLSRTTDPQTIFVKDALHRDDIVDTTDFDYVAYNYGVMKMALNEELAVSVMIGDGRDDGDTNKIDETHIRSVWNDDELFTIHKDVDFDAAKTELQGTDTDVYFGENYIYSEAIVTAALYSREGYKGSGALDFYCTPHLLNVMLLARDMNGRRIYDSKADLAKALNVNTIHTVEQFEGKTRITSDNKKKKLLGLFVNMNDYQIGATKGGEINKFKQFDMDFNQEKMLIETRVSGALIRIKSAIALEEDVTPASSSSSGSTSTDTNTDN